MTASKGIPFKLSEREDICSCIRELRVNFDGTSDEYGTDIDYFSFCVCLASADKARPSPELYRLTPRTMEAHTPHTHTHTHTHREMKTTHT